MPGKVSIVGLDKAEVLAALFNAARGDHFLGQPRRVRMTVSQAQSIIEMGVLEFGTHYNRGLRFDLSGEDLDPELYDKYNGEGAAARAIEGLRTAGAGGKGDEG